MRRIITSLPSAFIVFLLGVVLAILRRPNVVKVMKVGPSTIQIVKISTHSQNEGFINGAIPQLPLLVLNSMIAFYKLSSDLFLMKNCSVTLALVIVGLMNLVGCWFGALPCCHGAQELAGKYKFRGRSGGSVAIFAGAKLVLGLVIGSSLAKLLNQFPVRVLGVMLLFPGVLDIWVFIFVSLLRLCCGHGGERR